MEMRAAPRPRTAVFTIVSRNYLAFARVLMKSLARVVPEWDRVVLLADRIDEAFEPQAESFRVIEAATLPLPEIQRFLFRYTIVELNTAVKPWCFRHLFAAGYDRVVYLDPDIQAYAPLEDVERAFDEGALAVLVPHLTGRLADDLRPSEHEILQSGAYNLGFCALARHADLEGLLDYWCEKSVRGFVVDLQRGLFTDQRWMDLVPGMFRDVRVLRHEGYDVAYWNLPHRAVVEVGGATLVNGVPLVFFHFSGFDPLHPEQFSKHQNRYRLSTVGAAVASLARRYCEAVLAEGHVACRALPYTYGFLRDGSPIAEVMRRLYRTSPEVERWAGEDPFARTVRDWTEPLDASRPALSRVMLAVYQSRADIRLTWPDASGADREAFARWFAETADLREVLADCYVEPHRSALAGSTSPRPARARRLEVDPRIAVRPAVVTAALRKARIAAAEGRLPLSPRRWAQLFRLHVTELAQAELSATAPPLPSADWTSPNRPGASGFRFSGFHAQSPGESAVGVAWMERMATIPVERSGSPSTITVEGEHDPALHSHNGRSGALMLSLDVDGQQVTSHTVQQAGSFAIAATVPAGANGRSLLTLRASHGVVPQRVGLGEDGRELSFKLRRVSVDGHPVLDFSRAQPYSPRALEPPAPLGITIVGYFSAATGVAAGAQASVAACRAAGIGCEVLYAPPEGPSRGAHDLALLHVNADQTATIGRALGEDFFRDRYTIGWWAWELETLPDAFGDAFAWVDEVWAPSRFIQEAVAEKSPVPVVYMPCPVAVAPAPAATRRDFGLPDDRIVFLTMYDTLSVQERKNPLAVIDAYRRAFPDSRGVTLAVRVNHAASRPDDVDIVRREIARTAGAILLDGPLSRGEAHALQASCDVFVSLHRAEGFGLNIAEAMLLGKPVIVTGWSGNVDFTTHENACLVDCELVELARDHGPYRRGGRWAEPRIDQAATYMTNLASDVSLRQTLGQRGQATISAGFSPEAVGRRYRRRLEAIRRHRK